VSLVTVPSTRVGGIGGINARILDLGIRWRRVMSFTPGRFATGTHRLLNIDTYIHFNCTATVLARWAFHLHKRLSSENEPIGAVCGKHSETSALHASYMKGALLTCLNALQDWIFRHYLLPEVVDQMKRYRLSYNSSQVFKTAQHCSNNNLWVLVHDEPWRLFYSFFIIYSR
jgi:hypothetical protein